MSRFFAQEFIVWYICFYMNFTPLNQSGIFLFFQKVFLFSINYLKTIWANHRKKTIVFIIVLLGIIYFSHGSSQNIIDTHIIVDKHSIVDKVILSGRTESTQNVNLGFADSGRVSHVYVTEGDKVATGKTLAQLEMGDLSAQYTNARAGVVIAEANLKQSISNVDRVTREQDSIVETAKRNLYGNLEAYPTDSFSTAVPPTIYGSYQGNQPGKYVLDIYPSSTSTGASIRYSGLENGTTSLTVDNRVDLGNQGLYIQFPSNSGYLSTEWVIPVPNNRSSEYAGLKNTYETALATRDRAIENARADVTGGNASVMQARLDQARASLDQIVSAMTRRKITAPFSGTISKVSLKQGESTIGTTKDISPGISMLATDTYKVVIKIPEIDVSRVVAGTPVSINLDAYGPDVIFPGTLIAINPAETIVDGVPVYEGTVLFTDTDTRIRSGMTATVSIIIGQKTDVVAIPADYIREDKVLQKYFVNIVTDIDDNKTVEQEVKTGIRGSDGMTEIINGLAGGETLASIIKKK